MNQNNDSLNNLKANNFSENHIQDIPVSRFDLWFYDSLIPIVCAKKRLLAVSAILGLGIGAIIYNNIPKTYTAELSIIPLKGDTNLSGSFASYTGLKNISNLIESNIQDEYSSVTGNKLSAYFKSHWLIREIVEQYNLAPKLLNKDINKFSQEQLDTATKLFSKQIKINNLDFRKTNILKVSLVWDSPQLAAINLNRILKKLDLHLRTHAIERAESNIKYLDKMLTSLKDENRIYSLRSLILAQYQKIALAQISENYLFEIIEPPTPRYKHIGPNLLVCCIGTAFVLILMELIYFLIFKNKPNLEHNKQS